MNKRILTRESRDRLHKPADRRPVYVLLAANAISQVGNILTFVAIPWFVLQTTGSATKTGVIGAASAVPLIVAGIFGGAIVDRLGYRQASIAADIMSGVTVALVPVLHLTVGLAFWQLIVLVFLSALLDAPGSTARRSLVPELAELGDLPLERANASFEAINRAALLVGPPAAGVLIAALGASSVLFIDAATFGLSAALTRIGIPSFSFMAADQPGLEQAGTARGYMADVLDGFRYIL